MSENGSKALAALGAIKTVRQVSLTPNFSWVSAEREGGELFQQFGTVLWSGTIFDGIRQHSALRPHKVDAAPTTEAVGAAGEQSEG